MTKKKAGGVQQIEQKQAVLKTEITEPTGITTEKEEPVGDPVEYTQPTCNIGLSIGFTRNIGNYSSVKVQVSLHAPCYPHEVHETFDSIKELLDEKLGLLSDEVNKAHGLA